MKNLKDYLLSIFILVIVCSSCSIDDATDDILGGGKITATINGNQFKSVAEYDRIEITTVTGYYVIILGAGDAEGVKKLKGLAIGMVGEGYSTLSTGTSWNKVGSDSEINTAEAGYSEDDGSNDFETDKTESIYVNITSIDKDKKIISGEFNFTAVDEDTGKEYKATNGKFTNVPYTLTQL